MLGHHHAMRTTRATAVLAVGLACGLATTAPAQAQEAFPVEEATIAQIHRAMVAGRLTARGLVEQYLARIDARQIADRRDADRDVLRVFDQALRDLARGGAVVIDSVVIPEQDEIPLRDRACRRFKHDLENYLASLGDRASVRTLEEIIESGDYHPPVGQSLRSFNEVSEPPASDPQCIEGRANRDKLRAGVRRVMRAQRLDAIVFPTWSNPPRLIGDLNTPHGDNSQDLPPHTGFPAITVPMGWVRVRDDDLPVGLQILGDAWSEPTLIGIAYGYEQLTKHRRAPATTPPLSADRR